MQDRVPRGLALVIHEIRMYTEKNSDFSVMWRPQQPPPFSRYLEERLELRLIVGASLQQRGSFNLTRAEVDVRLHVGQLGNQDISHFLHWHVLTAALLSNRQRPKKM